MVMISCSSALLRTVQMPAPRCSSEPARRAHPVQRLVGAVVGVDGHRPVGLDQQEAGRHRQVGGEPSDVVDGAAGDDETHGRRRYRAAWNRSAAGRVLGT